MEQVSLRFQFPHDLLEPAALVLLEWPPLDFPLHDVLRRPPHVKKAVRPNDERLVGIDRFGLTNGSACEARDARKGEACVRAGGDPELALRMVLTFNKIREFVVDIVEI